MMNAKRPGSPAHYRLMCFKRSAGPWRATKDDAERDAVKRKMASYDEDRDMVFLGPAVWIAAR